MNCFILFEIYIFLNLYFGPHGKKKWDYLQLKFNDEQSRQIAIFNYQYI